MRHGLSLAGALLTLLSAAAACSGGASSDGATVIGRVQDEAGTGIEDAVVLLDGDNTTTNATGGFTFAAKKGKSVLDVTAAGYRRVNVELRIANGDNVVDITMVVCTPVVDAGCDVPTPTPTATPTPPNVVATFAGVNANADGAPAAFGAWTGSAVLTGAANTLNLGNDADVADLAFGECWADVAETNDYDGMGLDHCIFWWEGENQGGTVNPALNDAVFYVYIPGAEFTAGNTITLADGMTAGYYEGDFTVDLFQISDYTLQRSALEGSLTLGAVGMNDGLSVSITGQATFYIPNLP